MEGDKSDVHPLSQDDLLDVVAHLDKDRVNTLAQKGLVYGGAGTEAYLAFIRRPAGQNPDFPQDRLKTCPFKSP